MKLCRCLRRHAAVGCLFLLVCTGPADAQTNPVPQAIPLSQNWGTAAFGTMPAGFAAWNGLNGGSITSLSAAQNSTPTGNASLSTSPPSGTTPTGGAYAYLYGPNNAVLGIVTSSNNTNGVNQIAMALDTRGVTDITLDFDFIDIINNTRTVGCVVQYRIGDSGTWTTITGTGNPYVQSAALPEFPPGSPETVTHVSLALPPVIEEQPVVQIRWATWRGTESGSSSAYAVDNIVVGGSGGAGNTPTAFAGPDRTVPLVDGALPVVMTDATANDVDGLTGLTYAWTPATGTNIVGWTARTGNMIETTTPSEAQVTLSAAGTYTFTLTVTDPENHTASDDVVITVSPAAPGGSYDPPPAYYNPARPGGQWLNGSSLKSALNGIISGHVVRSYDSAKASLQLLDLDPNNPNNILLIYTGVSVPKSWDNGNTWNREHQWPDSLLLGSPQNSDLFELRPCNPGVNSTRGNDPYGIGAGFWDPAQGNAADRGACSRACFYMATRYTSLTLVNGNNPSTGQMADLSRMLEWHYEQPVTTFERRRNHLIWSSVENPAYHQGNRNPYIDHPELVWSVFGPGSNNSTLYVTSSPAPNGSSTSNVNFRVLVGAPLVTQSVTLNKTGANPTTFDIMTTGSATCIPAGPRHAFAGGTQSRTLLASFSSTAGVGSFPGSIIIDNTDVTSAATGQGSADANDTIGVSATVLAHSNASFNAATDSNTLMIDLGTYVANNGIQARSGAVFNLESQPGLTAELRINPPSSSGDTAKLSVDATYTGTVPAGGSRPFTASLDTTTPGSFSAAYTFTVADESIPGSAAGTPLVLTLVGQVVAADPPFAPADFDQDGDVDHNDINHFISCGTRAGVAISNPPCTNVDLDGDDDGDLDDFARVQRCYRGEALPVALTCGD